MSGKRKSDHQSEWEKEEKNSQGNDKSVNVANKALRHSRNNSDCFIDPDSVVYHISDNYIIQYIGFYVSLIRHCFLALRRAMSV